MDRVDFLPYLGQQKHAKKHRSKFFIIFVSLSLSILYFASIITCIYLNKTIIDSDYPLIPDYELFIKIPSKIHGKNQTFSIDMHSLVAYVDIWRGHWCPYYNDRNFFLSPRVNELLQIIRMFQIPVSHLSFTAESSMLYTRQRKRAKTAILYGNTTVLNEYEPYPNESYSKYIPGFIDKCNHNLSRFNRYRDHGFSKDICISDDDYYVSSFKEASMLFNGLGAKYVLIFGEHTNMCIMQVIMYCLKAGMQPIIVRDLVDCAWVYHFQKTTFSRHTESNSAVNKYIESLGVPSVLSYDLIRAFKDVPLKRTRPKYNPEENAYRFKNLLL